MLFKPILRLIAIDRAVAAAVLGRLWQSLAGIGTLFFVLRYFTPTIQGYFQTFLSLVALQAFVELGLLGVIVVVVSHEWSGLTLLRDRVSGPPEQLRRVAATIRFVSLWFGAASGIFFLGGGLIGGFILHQHGDPEIWLRPWLVTVGLAAMMLFGQSLIAVVEGSNRVFEVAVYRVVQSALSSIALWTCAALGFGLWSLAGQLTVSVACTIFFIARLNRRFFSQILRARGSSSFRWREDVWPMQWQLALQGIAGYFSTSLLVPVIFAYFGPVEAGRMGLSLQVVQAISALATSWLVVTLPRLAAAFASGSYSRFGAQWLQSSTASIVVFASAGAAVIAIVILGNERHVGLAPRFLTPLPFALLIIWGLMLQIVQCFAIYWRAQRVELLRFWGILPGSATGVLVWFFGQWFGTTGAAAGALAAAVFITVPLCGHLFLTARRSVRLMTQGAIERSAAAHRC